VTTLLNRIGNLGLLLIASALLLGGLAGAAVAHHYDSLSADKVAAHQNDKGQAAPKPNHQRGNPKHPSGGPQNGRPGSNNPVQSD
jgi:hypothetical protein